MDFNDYTYDCQDDYDDFVYDFDYYFELDDWNLATLATEAMAREEEEQGLLGVQIDGHEVYDYDVEDMLRDEEEKAFSDNSQEDEEDDAYTEYEDMPAYEKFGRR